MFGGMLMGGLFTLSEKSFVLYVFSEITSYEDIVCQCSFSWLFDTLLVTSSMSKLCWILVGPGLLSFPRIFFPELFVLEDFNYLFNS